jgi:hypothetical protein
MSVSDCQEVLVMCMILKAGADMRSIAEFIFSAGT